MILVAGLSPAWQQIMEFERVTPGEVNRAVAVHWCASGKVLNVAIAVNCLQGAEVRCQGTEGDAQRSTAAQPRSTLNEVVSLSTVGGWSGEAIKRDFAAHGVAAEWIDIPEATRVCTTILDRTTGQTTELVENAGAIPESALTLFRDRFRQLAPAASMVVLTGSLPSGVPATLYAELMKGLSVPVLLDCRGPELLHCLPLQPLVVKPNREELAKTVGRALSDDASVMAAARELNQAGARWVVVTDGPRAVLVTGSQGEEFRVVPKSVTPVVNPIGSGDCLAAGLAYGLTTGLSLRDSLEIGLCAAGENIKHLLPARCGAAQRAG